MKGTDSKQFGRLPTPELFIFGNKTIEIHTPDFSHTETVRADREFRVSSIADLDFRPLDFATYDPTDV